MNSETTNMIRVTDDVFIDGDNLIILWIEIQGIANV